MPHHHVHPRPSRSHPRPWAPVVVLLLATFTSGCKIVKGCEFEANDADVCTEKKMSAWYCREVFEGQAIEGDCAALGYQASCPGEIVTVHEDDDGGDDYLYFDYYAADQAECDAADGALFEHCRPP